MVKTACKDYVSLLREQLYRLLHSTCFWALLICIAVLSLLEIGVYSLMNNAITQNGWDTESYFKVNTLFSGFYSIDTLGLFVLIFAAVLGCGEFSNHTMRGKLSSGFTRTGVYFATLTINYLVAIFYTLVATAVLLAVGIPSLGWDSTRVNVADVFSVLFAELPAIAFITMICFCVRSRGASIAINIAVLLGGSLISSIFVMLVDYSKVFEWLVRLLFICLNTYIEGYGVNNSNMVTLSYVILNMVLNYLVTTILCVLGGWLAFLRAEVK